MARLRTSISAICDEPGQADTERTASWHRGRGRGAHPVRGERRGLLEREAEVVAEERQPEVGRGAEV